MSYDNYQLTGERGDKDRRRDGNRRWGDGKVRKEKLHMMRWTKRERHTGVLSALMVRNRSIRIWQPLEKQASRDPPLRDHCLLWKGQRDPEGDDSAKQERTRHISWRHMPPLPCTREMCLQKAVRLPWRRPQWSQQSLPSFCQVQGDRPPPESLKLSL